MSVSKKTSKILSSYSFNLIVSDLVFKKDVVKAFVISGMANDLDDITKINVIVFINFLKNFILKLDDLLTKYKCNIKNLKKPVNTKLLVFKKILIYQIVTDLLQISFDSFSKNLLLIIGIFPKGAWFYPSTIKRLSRR